MQINTPATPRFKTEIWHRNCLTIIFTQNELLFEKVETMYERFPRMPVYAFATAIAITALSGCAREEKILEIKTPGADIEVRKKTDGTGTTVDVDRKP